MSIGTVTVGGSRLSFSGFETVAIAAVKTSEGEEFFIEGADYSTYMVQRDLLRRFKDASIQMVAYTPERQQAGLGYHKIGKTLDEAVLKSMGFQFLNRNRIYFYSELTVKPDFSVPLPSYDFHYDRVAGLLERLNNAERYYEFAGEEDPDSVSLKDKVLFMISEIGLKATDDLVSKVIENQGAIFTEGPFFRGYSHDSQLSELQIELLHAILDCNENLYKGIIYNPWLFEAYRNHESGLSSDPLSEPLASSKKADPSL